MSELSSLKETPKLNKKTLDLNQVIKNTLSEMMIKDWGKEHIKTHLNPLPPIEGDEAQLKKLITNLVLNAKEATDVISTKEKPRISICTNKTKDWVIFSISDNGPGMSSDFVEKHLFKPFHSTKKGLGIGLFQCKTIVEAHAGKIEVETSPETGSIFKIFLPI